MVFISCIFGLFLSLQITNYVIAAENNEVDSLAGSQVSINFPTVRVINNGAQIAEYPLSSAEGHFENLLMAIQKNVNSAISPRAMPLSLPRDNTSQLKFSLPPSCGSTYGVVDVTTEVGTGCIFIADVLYAQGQEFFTQGVRWAINPRIRDQLGIKKQLAYVAAEQGDMDHIVVLLRSIRETPGLAVNDLEDFYESIVAATIRCNRYTNLRTVLGLLYISRDWGATNLYTLIHLGECAKQECKLPPYALAASLGHAEMITELNRLRFPYQDNGNGLRSALFQASKSFTNDPGTIECLLNLISENESGKPCGLPPELLRSDAFAMTCLRGHQEVSGFYTRLMPHHVMTQNDFPLPRFTYPLLNRGVTHAALGGHEGIIAELRVDERSFNLNCARTSPLWHVIRCIQSGDEESEPIDLSSHTIEQALRALDILSRNGMNFEITEFSSGKAALHFAVEHYQSPHVLRLVDGLLRYGCNPHAIDKQGRTPWTLLQELMSMRSGPPEEVFMPRRPHHAYHQKSDLLVTAVRGAIGGPEALATRITLTGLAQRLDPSQKRCLLE